MRMHNLCSKWQIVFTSGIDTLDIYEILIIKNLNSQNVSKEKDIIIYSNHV